LSVQVLAIQRVTLAVGVHFLPSVKISNRNSVADPGGLEMNSDALESVEKKPVPRNAGYASRNQNLNEEALVTAARGGHTEAFDQLWQCHAKRILRTACRITRNHADAEDALQDSLLKAFVHIGDFDGRSSFSSWLTRIAINSALMILRKKRSALELSLDDPGTQEKYLASAALADRAPDPEAGFARRQEEQILQAAIRELRPSIRQAVELQKLKGHPLAETAQMMGLSITATKSRLYHAKTELRQSLKTGSARLTRATAGMDLLPAA
jgi:RNA polymerase sigma-70 factor (ECF subfamily)